VVKNCRLPTRPKPRGLVWVPAGRRTAFSRHAAGKKNSRIGEVTKRALRALRIETVRRQIAAMPQEKLENIFGQWGTALYRKARAAIPTNL